MRGGRRQRFAAGGYGLAGFFVGVMHARHVAGGLVSGAIDREVARHYRMVAITG